MQENWHDDLALLLAFADDYQMPHSRKWRPNAHHGLVDLLNDAVAIAWKAYKTSNADAFSEGLEAVFILLEEASDALAEHPDTRVAQEFVKNTHTMLEWIKEAVTEFQTEAVDDEAFAEAMEEMQVTLATLRTQLN